MQEETLSDIMARYRSWATETFGPPESRGQTTFTHFIRELKELSDCPWDEGEMADVVFLMDGYLASKGTSLESALAKKLEINLSRRWGDPDSEGVREHVR